VSKPRGLKVFSNLAVSIDGRIADARSPHKPLGTTLDRKTMQVIRRKAEAVVFGAETLRASQHVVRIQKKPGEKSPPSLVNAVITASGELDPDWPFWEAEDVLRFVFTGDAGFEKALLAARDRAFVINTGGPRVDPRKVLERLAASGLKNILVEGGGEIIALFLQAGLLDEMYITLTPWALGGRQNPSLIGGEGLTDWTRLKLLSSKRAKDEIYLHYQVRKTVRS
jgi:riboflavin-specific deaminase-like protein